jgi:hypothetical protein
VIELTARLGSAARFDVLVLPYGSAFPIEAWPSIQTFLRHGGGLAVLGGAPFAVPVRAASNNAWIVGPRQGTFAHDLLIGPAEPVALDPSWKTVTLPGKDATLLPDQRTTWALTLRLATEKEFPGEHGSAGPRDAVARPLAHVIDGSGTPRGCPLLEIDRLRGESAGARWVFATTDAKLDAFAVHSIVTRALARASELRVIPLHATVAPGERADLRVESKRFGRAGGAKPIVHVDVTDAAGREVFSSDAKLKGPPEAADTELSIDAPTRPGLYHVIATGAGQTARTGFWVRDEKLLASGPKVSVSSDWLRKDGQVFPIVGTTYMSPDVHRHFLFEPNPDAWDADFSAMKKRGINFVRTGIWTAWSRVMTGADVDERVLRALEAYVMTAAKHGIVVCFNLFAFLPPAYGGTNPYLDEPSLRGQTHFVRAFASRFKNSSWIHWDLINEPSYAPPSKLWRTRPIGDASEAKAWQAFVHRKHGEGNGELRTLWRSPEVDVLAVPRDEDFAQTAVQIDKRPRKVRDFREFTDVTVARWAQLLRDEIKDAGGRETLVTLGQDEGGIYERATQQLMAGSLDYTAVHTWWKNDDLLWDGVVTKVSGKPSLHQETGLMRLEDVDGLPWRTPEDAALLLERKVGYAFAGRGAGLVEWVWNVNPYMPIDEESTIGLFRPDGTAKPELDVLARFAELFARAAPYLDDFEPDPVVLVIPHARAFLGMTGALDATKHVVRALAERFGVVPAAKTDLDLDAKDLEHAKLVIVAGADVLDARAATALEAAAGRGTKVLITGAIQGDSYGRPIPSLTTLGVLGPSRPVAMHERSEWADGGWVAFEGMLQESTRRSTKPALTKRGDAIWHEPLPLELARDREPLVKLLRSALAWAKVPTSPDVGGVAGRVLLAPKTALLVAVNERPEPATRRLVVDGHAIDLRVGARGATVMLVERLRGKPLAAMH